MRHAGPAGRRRVHRPAGGRVLSGRRRWRSRTRLCETIAESVPFERRALQIVGSIGIAHNLDGIVAPEVLLRNADIAMYDAKAARRRPAAGSSTTSMHQRVVDRMSLGDRICARRSSSGGCARSSSRSSTSAPAPSAASRPWPAGPPASTTIPPAEFIPVAEESGLIGQLGCLVLRDACRTLSQWRTAGARRRRGHGQRQRLGPPDHGRRAGRSRPRGAGRLRPAPGEPRPGDHREHAHREPADRQHRAARSCWTSASRSSSTTSAPATRRSPCCTTSPATR